MVPVLQIQQLTLSFLVNRGYIQDLNGINSEYRGSRIEGTLLSFEMLIIAMASHFIYRAEDLKHWEHKQQYRWDRQPKRRTTGASKMSHYDDDNESRMSDMPISELSGISHVSINNAPSSLLGGGKYNAKKPLLAMPEDHSLRDLSLTEDHNGNHQSYNGGSSRYKSLE
eukprot:CAMPEP_0201586548 /NCGR_PEP_ID=MMETSP0190_2-20130828/133929_1 /ASSEMBLY_ACC=CAM_ASM_000263 /TAXON_ID=37353 /ORGANISM="Rosalina sp." /LENGTH=168 /DNA_ID=CAMNT_0048034757 /DNA_START=703 /DNA_END=1209 /DNA_ORIENTATION=+